VDGWSHRLRYAITPAYTRNITSVDDGTIEIVTRNLDGAELKLTTAGGLTPVVVLSTARMVLARRAPTATGCPHRSPAATKPATPTTTAACS
jgi:hypothetical protein